MKEDGAAAAAPRVRIEIFLTVVRVFERMVEKEQATLRDAEKQHVWIRNGPIYKAVRCVTSDTVTCFLGDNPGNCPACREPLSS